MSTSLSFQRGDQVVPDFVRKTLAPVLDRVEKAIGHRLVRIKPDRIKAPLGCGSYGCVFELGDPTLVLKVSDDKLEGPYSLYMKDLQDKGTMTPEGPIVACTVRVHGVWSLPTEGTTFAWKTMWVILLERVVPSHDCEISPALESAADLYTDGWEKIDKVKTFDFDDLYRRKMVSEGEKDIEAGLVAMRRTKDGKAIAAFLDAVKRDGAPLTDMHRDNLCRRLAAVPGGGEPGQVVVVDYGISKVRSSYRRRIGRLPESG